MEMHRLKCLMHHPRPSHTFAECIISNSQISISHRYPSIRQLFESIHPPYAIRLGCQFRICELVRCHLHVIFRPILMRSKKRHLKLGARQRRGRRMRKNRLRMRKNRLLLKYGFNPLVCRQHLCGFFRQKN